jgi:hypothetical protein
LKVKGNPAKLGELAESLRRLPSVLEPTAARSAGVITRLVGASFDAGETVYGRARPVNEDGSFRSLHKSGALRGGLRFVRVGTKLRCVLGVRYARYRIKDGILPYRGNLPKKWDTAIGDIATEEIQRVMGGAK